MLLMDGRGRKRDGMMFDSNTLVFRDRDGLRYKIYRSCTDPERT
jgi:hypothetical protein